MASIKLILDTRKARKDGTYPLKIGVSLKGYFQINLKIYLHPDQWVENTVVMPENKKTAERLNNHIATFYQNANSQLLVLKAMGELRNMSDKELCRQLDTGYSEPKEKPALFKDRCEAYISTLDRTSTIGTFENMFKKVRSFSNM